MKLDNFTTARCKNCGWLKQFQPGREYESKECECNCTPEAKAKKAGRPPKVKYGTFEKITKED